MAKALKPNSIGSQLLNLDIKQKIVDKDGENPFAPHMKWGNFVIKGDIVTPAIWEQFVKNKQ